MHSATDQNLPRDYLLCSTESLIYTVDPKFPRVQCILISDGRIKNVGTIEEVSKKSEEIFYGHSQDERGTEIERVYLKPGQAVVPGLADAHAHVLEWGFKRQLELDSCNSVQDVLNRVVEYIKSHPDVESDHSRWIEGMGWNQTKWPGGQFPRSDDFDTEPLLRGRPILLKRVDGHASWASNKVLEIVGDLPDSHEGGEIVRDADGKPTGIFIDNAMSLVKTPPWTEGQMTEYFEATMRDAIAHGLTSIHDADSPVRDVEMFKKMAENGQLPVRLYAMGRAGEEHAKLEHYGREGRLTLRSIKIIADGALGSWGAAMLEPYSDKPETSGLLLFSRDRFEELVRKYDNDNFQINVHCIGDRAHHVILDVFAAVFAERDLSNVRPRIEHAQIIHMEDLGRIAKMGVIPSVQPTHATSDMWYAETRLGTERLKGAYAYRTLLENSPQQVLPIGSDFPVEDINPIYGFYAAITRLSHEGDSPHGPGGWYEKQKLTREQALKGMTLDAAYASFAEDEIGSLSPGKRADFVVLDRDIMTISQEQILGTQVLATVVDGRVAYGSIGTSISTRL